MNNELKKKLADKLTVILKEYRKNPDQDLIGHGYDIIRAVKNGQIDLSTEHAQEAMSILLEWKQDPVFQWLRFARKGWFQLSNEMIDIRSESV